MVSTRCLCLRSSSWSTNVSPATHAMQKGRSSRIHDVNSTEADDYDTKASASSMNERDPSLTERSRSKGKGKKGKARKDDDDELEALKPGHARDGVLIVEKAKVLEDEYMLGQRMCQLCFWECCGGAGWVLTREVRRVRGVGCPLFHGRRNQGRHRPVRVRGP